MDFRLSAEQELLRDSARRLFSTPHPAQDAWRQFAELGWLAMPVPEAQGGLGAAREDIALLCEEMGRALSPAGFIGGAILPATLLAACHLNAAQAQLPQSLMDGEVRLAVAAFEPELRYALQAQTRAVADADGGYRLSGRKTLVAGGAEATHLLVSARLDDQTALFVVEIANGAVRRRTYPTVDGVMVADFEFDAVSLAAQARLQPLNDSYEVLEHSFDQATLYLCAEMLGGMDRAIELTAEYLKLRKQFGKPLADFQVLQHAVAEMFIEANGARSILYRALAHADAPRVERQRAISACFIKLMQAAKSVTGSAVHLHGGIGVSCEYPVGAYLQRVIVAERIFGDREQHLARYMG